MPDVRCGCQPDRMLPCPFCSIIDSKAPATVLARDDSCMALLDISPVARGHALVIPIVHAPTLRELPPEVRQALLSLAHDVLDAIRSSGLPCAGANLLLNDGRAANQHIPHVHVHVVPRASGDFPRIVRGLLLRALRGHGFQSPRADLEYVAALIRPHLTREGRT